MIGAIRSASFRRLSTKQPFLFLPNDNSFKLESEKLTPEENRAAIPPRPNFEDVEKYHHEIPNPENIPDIFSQPTFNDLFTTILTKNAIFTGNTKHRVVTSDEKNEALRLYFANTAVKWFEVFNNSVFELKPMGHQKEGLTYFNQLGHEKITSRVAEARLSLSQGLFTREGLDELFSTILLDKSLILDPLTISFGALANYFLHSSECVESKDSLLQIMMYVNEHTLEMTSEHVQNFVAKLVNVLYENNDNDSTHILECLHNIVSDPVVAHILPELESHILDKLAYLHTKSLNFEKARAMLDIIIQDRKIAPSSETFEFYLSSYIQHLGTPSSITKIHPKVLRELKSLKPAIFHHGISSKYSSQILEVAVTNEYELEQFLNLVLSSKHAKEVLITSAEQIVQKAMDLIQEQPEVVREVKRSNIVNRIECLGYLDTQALQQLKNY